MSENNNRTIGYKKVGVIGGGAWGTALALVAAQAGADVTLWARESDVVESINAAHRNDRFLPGIELPLPIHAAPAMTSVAAADALFIAAPAQHLRSVLAALRPQIKSATPLMLCAKGIERGTGLLLTEVLRATIPAAVPAILSGPSFARDVALGLPTAVTVAAEGPVARRLQETLGTPAFRPYASDDLTGVALGGAAKNVYAIGCGTADGLGLGESARAALLARSFAELARLGDALGARVETLMGLSGLGDLVLTATSPSSRNFAFGQQLGRGTSLATLKAPGTPLAEGVETAPALVARARELGVELPIAETIAALLSGALAPGKAIEKLMARPLRPE